MKRLNLLHLERLNRLWKDKIFKEKNMRLTNLDECNRELFYKQMGGKDKLITVESAFNMLMLLPTVNVTEIVDSLVTECERFKNQYKTFYFQDLVDISKKVKEQYKINI